jgi:ABC-2 type transport system permease protein
VAYRLEAGRDVDAGILPTRAGPAEGASWLRRPLALAWRLQWGTLAGWTAGLALYGIVIGAVANSAADIVSDNTDMADMIERLGGTSSVVDSFIAASLGFLGYGAAGYAIQATLRLRSEETSGRAEPVLATATTRLRWTWSHLVFAVLGPAAALGLAGLATGLSYGINAGDVGGQVPRIVAAALVQLPAVWVLGSVALLLFGLLPRRTVWSWGALLFVVLVGFVGELLELGQWALDLSPFTHIPKLPGGTFSAVPLVALTALAALISALGLTGVHRRDLG